MYIIIIIIIMALSKKGAIRPHYNDDGDVI